MRALTAVALLLLAACSKHEEPKQAEADAQDEKKAAEAQKAKEAATAAALEKLSATLSKTCAAEFERIAKEGLVPGAEQPCELGAQPELRHFAPGSRSTLAELPESMKKSCAKLQEELDGAVKSAGPGNT